MKSGRHHTANKRVRSDRSGASTAAQSQIGGYTAFESLREFASSDGRPDRKAAIVEKLLASRHLDSMHKIGAMCIELARDKPTEAFDWLGRAETTLHEAVDSYAVSGIKRSVDMFRAMRLLDSMPHYISVLGFRKLPNITWNQKMTDAILKTSTDTLNMYTTTSKTNDAQRIRRKELTGELSEQAVHLLALRAAAQIGPEEWSPVPSYFTQDNSALIAKSARISSWDLTVQTADNHGVDEAYKIQVKHHDRAVGDQSKYIGYTDDVTMLYVNPYLALYTETEKANKGKIFLPGIILNELCRESQGDTSVVERLDQRQEQMLSILDGVA